MAVEALPPAAVALVEVLPNDFAITRETVDGKPRGICIEATLIATTVLRRLGVECRPMACDVFAFNAAALPLYLAGVAVPDWPPEAWSVGVALDADPTERAIRRRYPDVDGSVTEPYRRKGWDGHLVVTGAGWFLDLTAEQFHRPDHDIVVGGAVGGPTLDDPRGVVVDLDGGGAMLYRWRPEVAGYRTTPAWRQDVPPGLVVELAALVQHRVAS